MTAPASPALSHYRLTSVDVFGSRRYSREESLATFGVPEGRDVDLAGGELYREAKQGKERLLSRFAFAQARIGITNHEDTRTVEVTVNLVDVGHEWRLVFAPAPEGSPGAPDGLVATWGAYEEKAGALFLAGQLTVGEGPCKAFHCGTGFGHPGLAPLKARFITGVPTHFEALVKVLRTEKDEHRRSLVPFLLAYGRTREAVAEALLPSVLDSSYAVRNNASRVPWQTQRGASKALVPLAPVLRALHGPASSDRNKAAVMLGAVVEKDPSQRRGPARGRAGAAGDGGHAAVNGPGSGPACAARPGRKRPGERTLARGRSWAEEMLSSGGAGEAARK
ncbi:hypothetical protein [Pyxidicoccus xibeiensis]|uniref:hypothetical protein n=1 Tax=Pyxidicoccus xibeiensis TaxID=2906759 RepID=UPI0020A7E805|nr:hypothetical protein [Pyxidicoccus xibeiensis]MCP3140755.1 hypothetical protein [Pyxidicoccus xibeiensis]